MMKPDSPLPYTDTKPVGAADFYFAINATFRFIDKTLGREGWLAYLQHLGTTYFAPVNQQWKAGGLPAIALYWTAFFEAEPEAKVVVSEGEGAVEIEVRQCPAIHHLRAHHREIFPFYCQHCQLLGSSRASEAGFALQVKGGNGTCHHRYTPLEPANPVAATPSLEEIALC